MTKIHRLTDAVGLQAPARYLSEVRQSLQRIEEILASADGFRQVDAGYRLRTLAECADNVHSELLRTAVARVAP